MPPPAALHAPSLQPPSLQPPDGCFSVHTIEAHTGGEPLRIVTNGLPPIPGATMFEKRRYARTHLDHLRRALMWEPRGHADMYGAWITEPVTDDGDLGVLFLHNEGFSTMCGHGIIALATALLESHMMERPGPAPILRLDTPAGRVTATAHRDVGGRVREVSFENVPSFVLALDESFEVPGIGPVVADIAFGGAFYAYVDALSLGLTLDADGYRALIDAGQRIKHAIMAARPIHHPMQPDLGFLYGVIFVGPPHDGAHHSRNVCVFADGEVDRSPTGTGVSGRAALLHARGELPAGVPITIESIVGSTFGVVVECTASVGDLPAVIPRVTGSAEVVGLAEWWIDPATLDSDPFLLR
jgi:trans-L-3-hydroxyproline dehydratase